MIAWLLIAVLVPASGVLAQACSNFTIDSIEKLQAARQCPEIDGDVVVGPYLREVNLDGIQRIHGSLVTMEVCAWDRPKGCKDEYPLEIISSSTLTAVDEIQIIWNANLRNISLPNLKAVETDFMIHYLENLEYLDITGLETVGGFTLRVPSLTTLKHNGLRNITGYGRNATGYGSYSNETSLVLATGLESLDSVFRYPLSVFWVAIEVNSKNKEIHFGFANTTLLQFEGQPYGEDTYPGAGNVTIIFGGHDAENVHVDYLRCRNATNGLKRQESLNRLTVDEINISGNDYLEHLDLPFDQLGELYVSYAPNLRWLSNHPQASEWTDFALDMDAPYHYNISRSPLLNLSSEYMIDEAGNTVRSWYWPQKNIKKIDLGAIMTDAFL
ncbi:hypothetical protein CGLO_04473 [Colletotrichum gloeosporioides Cg-14]|uniref:Uncharacterized protein n=1 Tax=Colletotrichum gloeosporioides (strain Cg-14) TaxID=1237896 RepID=T0KU13_COLGC|nr:hypothetical protein CGLO_04473 [Colletotrichum gloeosporioides Cg-14]